MPLAENALLCESIPERISALCAQIEDNSSSSVRRPGTNLDTIVLLGHEFEVNSDDEYVAHLSADDSNSSRVDDGCLGLFGSKVPMLDINVSDMDGSYSLIEFRKHLIRQGMVSAANDISELAKHSLLSRTTYPVW